MCMPMGIVHGIRIDTYLCRRGWTGLVRSASLNRGGRKSAHISVLIDRAWVIMIGGIIKGKMFGWAFGLRSKGSDVSSLFFCRLKV